MKAPNQPIMGHDLLAVERFRDDTRHMVEFYILADCPLGHEGQYLRRFLNEDGYAQVESRAADIGFVFSRTNYPDIISKPVYRELMYLICHKDSPYHDDISCEELRPEDEIHLRWGPDYEQWHDAHWGKERYSLLTVNTGSTLQHYLDRPGRWAVAPMSVVHEFSHNPDLTYYTFRDPPMPRICYMLTNRYPNARRQELIETFERELVDFIARSEDICSFENWMLSEKGSVRSQYSQV